MSMHNVNDPSRRIRNETSSGLETRRRKAIDGRSRITPDSSVCDQGKWIDILLLTTVNESVTPVGIGVHGPKLCGVTSGVSFGGRISAGAANKSDPMTIAVEI